MLLHGPVIYPRYSYAGDLFSIALTCPDSNIIGAYSLVPRIAGAEVGWTSDQWLHVIDRLKAADLAWYDAERMFVWVRIWWEHHHASQTMGPKLRARTLDDIRRLPPPWSAPFLGDFRTQLNNEHRCFLEEALQAESLVDMVSVPYESHINTSSNFSRRNTNANSNSNSNLTPTPAASPVPVDNSGIPQEHRASVAAAISKALQAGVAKSDAQAVLDVLAQQFKSNSPPRDPAALAYYLSQNLTETPRTASKPSATAQELLSLKGRCFGWPDAHPTSFARVGDDGYFDQYAVEGGRVVRRSGHVERAGLLLPIRQNRLREVSSADVDKFARGC